MVPHVCDAQDEFPSRVQRIFLLATFHTEDVDLAVVASGGNVFGVWGEGDRPRVDWRGEQKGGKVEHITRQGKIYSNNVVRSKHKRIKTNGSSS